MLTCLSCLRNFSFIGSGDILCSTLVGVGWLLIDVLGPGSETDSSSVVGSSMLALKAYTGIVSGFKGKHLLP